MCAPSKDAYMRGSRGDLRALTQKSLASTRNVLFHDPITGGVLTATNELQPQVFLTHTKAFGM